jgi:ADP-heptose:LPS heptosyltransferase
MEYVLLVVSALISRVVNLSGWFRSRRIERILVFKVDHLGDVITATPALDHLRKRYPEAEITLVVGPWSAPIMQNHLAVDTLVSYRSPWFDRGKDQRPVQPLRDVLPRARYDFIVGLRDDRATLLASLRLGAHRRVDRGSVRIGLALRRLMCRWWGSSEHVPNHEVETNLLVVGGDVSVGGLRPRLHVTENAREWVDRELLNRLGHGKGYVVLHPGAFSPLRRWFPERFAEVARVVLDRTELAVVITGSPEEAALAESIARQAGPGALSIAGETSLPQVTAVVERAEAMVSLDTGLMHVATAVGTPVVALVGPEEPARFGPYGEGHAVIYHKLPCSPCDQVHCVRRSPECMEAISTEEVASALMGCLDSGKRPGSTVPAT